MCLQEREQVHIRAFCSAIQVSRCMAFWNMKMVHGDMLLVWCSMPGIMVTWDWGGRRTKVEGKGAREGREADMDEGEGMREKGEGREAQTNVQMCSSCISEKEFNLRIVYRHCLSFLFLSFTYHTTPCHITCHHTELHHITPHRTTLHHITLHCITSHHLEWHIHVHDPIDVMSANVQH